MNFRSLVTQHFNFLESEFGFQNLKEGVGFEKNGLELEFHGGNGQVDINFFVSKSDEIFKPFISRSFTLNSILRKVSIENMAPYPNSINGYLTADSDINLHLTYYAQMLKQHGQAILNGDLTVFENIHKERKGNAKKTS